MSPITALSLDLVRLPYLDGSSRLRADGHAISSLMAYWWASQNKNYRVVIPNGTLWTRPRVDGVMPENRRMLQDLEIDDVVFHYGGPYVRAVSRVVASATDWPRPPGYPYGPRESESVNDDGKLVRVELIASGLELHRDEVAQIISHGTPGPLSQYGIPREAYISPLTVGDAEALLAAVGVSIPNRTLPGRPQRCTGGLRSPAARGVGEDFPLHEPRCERFETGSPRQQEQERTC